MNDNYSGQTAIYAGMQGPPSWAQGLDLYEWVQVPGNTLASIDPAKDPAINPNYPHAAPWKAIGGQQAIISAWCGGCFDEQTQTYMLPLGGGHADYAGNEPYAVNMFSDNPQWRMLRNPSGAIGNTINLNDGQEATAVYADGRPRSPHSYSFQCAGNGRFFVGALVAVAYSGQAGKNHCYEINLSTGEPELVLDYSNLVPMQYGGCAYDTKRDKILIVGNEASRHILIDVTARTAAHISGVDNYCTGNLCPVYAANVDRYFIVSGQTTNTAYKAYRGLTVINPIDNSIIFPSVPNFPSWLKLTCLGAVWQPSERRLLLWNNVNSATTRNVLALYPSNYEDLSAPWLTETISGTGVSPTVATENGTYNRLQYSQRLGGLFVVNAVDQQIYFMRTD